MMRTKLNLSNQVVFITGGTSGIGHAIALKFASLGSTVIICGRKKKLLDSITSENKNIFGFAVDLSQDDAVVTIIEYFKKNKLSPSILVNNAAVGDYMDFTNVQFEKLEKIIANEIKINFQAVVLLSSALLPMIKFNDFGAIINITSGLSLSPKKSTPVYCATKSAVRAFTKSLRYQVEDEKLNIRLMEVLPPVVDTPMTKKLVDIRFLLRK